MSRVQRRWEDYAKAVMQEQDPEKLTYFIRQLNLALDGDEKLAFPPTRRKSDAAAQRRFRAKDKQAHPELGRLDTAIAVLPELGGPAQTGQPLEPRPVASLPHAGDMVLSTKESITCRVDLLRTEVADIHRSNEDHLHLKRTERARQRHIQRRGRLGQIIEELEALRNRTIQLR